jgi:hypothetical protein
MAPAQALKSSRKITPLKKASLYLTPLLFLITLSPIVRAQTYGSRTHKVTVTVATINKVNVSSGSVAITITGAATVAGQNLIGSVVNTSTTLYWASNSSGKKITVQSNLAAPTHTLALLALSPTAGTAAAEVTLSTTPTDFMTNIGRTLGSCTLQYTGTALATEGTGTDTHTVTFTITS